MALFLAKCQVSDYSTNPSLALPSPPPPTGQKWVASYTGSAVGFTRRASTNVDVVPLVAYLFPLPLSIIFSTFFHQSSRLLLTLPKIPRGIAEMTDSVKTQYQWLSQLNVDHVPAERNFRRTSIICTIGMCLDPRSIAGGLANSSFFLFRQ